MKRRALRSMILAACDARRSSWWSPTRLRTAPDSSTTSRYTIHRPDSSTTTASADRACSRRRRGTHDTTARSATIASATTFTASWTAGVSGPGPERLPSISHGHLRRIFVLQQPLREPQRLVPAELVQIALRRFQIGQFLPGDFVDRARRNADREASTTIARRAPRNAKATSIPAVPAVDEPDTVGQGAVGELADQHRPGGVVPTDQVSASHDHGVGATGPQGQTISLHPCGTSTVACRSCRHRRARCRPGRSRSCGPPAGSSTGKSGFSIGVPMNDFSIGPMLSLASRGPMFQPVGVITW